MLSLFKLVSPYSSYPPPTPTPKYSPVKVLFTNQKKITHMWRKRGATQNFCLAFTDELEKQLFIKKTVKVDQ